MHKEAVGALSKSHGDSKSRLYRIWKGIKTRVSNKNRTQSKDYALRGITICKEWLSYEKFKEWSIKNGYKDWLTIDRINNNGNYSPDNCRWATYKEQNRNKRNTHILAYRGMVYHTIKDMCYALGLKYGFVQSRIRRGWPVNEAVELGICMSGPQKEGQNRKEREIRK
jgi:hypothetical protein